MLATIVSALIAIAAPSPACHLSNGDQAWLDRSMRAWDYASTHLSGIGHVKKIEAIIFDKDCVVTSTTAMNGGRNAWSARRHGGQIQLPDGNKIPVTVTSFAGSDPKTGNFFVMSTPSVWRAGGKDGKGTTLENLMTAVMLHEGTHVAQMPTYGKEIGKIAERNHLPDSFSDDSIQEEFGKNPVFTASVERESLLLFNASQAKSRAEAARLVRSALTMMKARQARWYTGKNSYQAEAEALWLTLEGSGQWLAYSWEVDPHGGRIRASDVLPGFKKDRWWSQREGFAAFMALQRLTGTAWKQETFRGGRRNIIQMLEEAVASRKG